MKRIRILPINQLEYINNQYLMNKYNWLLKPQTSKVEMQHLISNQRKEKIKSYYTD